MKNLEITLKCHKIIGGYGEARANVVGGYVGMLCALNAWYVSARAVLSTQVHLLLKVNSTVRIFVCRNDIQKKS